MDDLSRARAAELRYWREQAEARPDGAWADVGGTQVHTTGLAPRWWNGAFVTGASYDLGAVAQWFAGHDREYGVLVPAELPPPAGLQQLTDQRLMLRGLDDVPLPPLPADVELVWDGDVGDLAAVQAEAFEVDVPTTLAFVAPTADVHPSLVAYVDGGAVGCATAAVLGDVLGVYGVGVGVAARRRGLGSALTAAVLHAGRSAGCTLAYLNPSELGHGSYVRLGFRPAPGHRVYLPG